MYSEGTKKVQFSIASDAGVPVSRSPVINPSKQR